MNTELTVIIPFKNEEEEVEKTIRSLNDMACGNINIIVINDASDDGYDYSGIALERNVEYIIHKESLGPAQSRAHGVELCETEYFLLLDAHMRALTKGWDELILKELEINKRAVFCCKTERLLDNDKISDGEFGLGVNLNFEDLSYNWIQDHSSIQGTIMSIPCVMGASYCTNKRYWNKIRGLEGLRSYGYEEQLLSIKTMLEGGNCYAITNVSFAHKFRTFKEVPYKASTVDYVFNQLYIIELFYPVKLKTKIFKKIKCDGNDNTFEIALNNLSKIKNEIISLKEYYKANFSRELEYITDFTNL